MSRIYVLAELKDTNTTVDELKLKVKMFCDERDWGKYHNLKELTIGLVTESAELLQLFRFKSETDMSTMLQTPELMEKVYDEVADIFYFLLRLSQLYNIDLSSTLERKLAKNAQRYPVDKFRGSNKKADEI
ncbi:nucleotide pyrophosphohydrolase [Candidatus Marsarchaeota G2 archaeon OSP_D]|jgi:NTP pyrophosphatase (non-canonical NTP hydrolase)|uniref:Nucleotide pyrophosphohydrolase n=5 Tax=Candidatus Marsarchaeota group 2 TaxID=2203771 RepID=A0A2R6C602_9ARCH|nr:MAG: nucleotide pyrophosphohydrolase [Candidatus Marsarchaeota G2 archaeon OSP_D]PSN95047.1 MAG: nucleotide pyrophosphohydrolase [Candidatus Marsarchaeota G2 archaeon ECH_B_2]PSN99597.1 MAG: nucleotide pyrophosphohydrolase [Candidatus Marsarchaeota G2 archaeon ECH_B_3]PSO01893.1 MAG: nucleotide pyrophosphohydrolase [Candidatus Marsarchaeota G2 archaeon ECH_B_1]PSO06339.1 MAG: nucleotide pyrophosphohydrolase [Candidatus Marsarchaeota G2 archaeon BE_D]